jgi:folate-dependent phosphoribosylglycinamide formyltransferase PurN
MSNDTAPNSDSADGAPGAAPGADASCGRVVLLTAEGPLATFVAAGLAASIPNLTVVVEPSEPRGVILRRRARLLGWIPALGQVACGVAARLINRGSGARRREIVEASGLPSALPASVNVHRVPSVNSVECRALLQALNPAAVAVYGTRIIKPETLSAIAAPFINYHAGINPKYRGQEPAYWALAHGDAGHAGVTIHLVDAGVDTGDVLYQKTVRFERSDNLYTYHWVQAVEAIPLFAAAIDDALRGALRPYRVDLPSQIHFPPTIWAFLWNGVRKGVW